MPSVFRLIWFVVALLLLGLGIFYLTTDGSGVVFIVFGGVLLVMTAINSGRRLFGDPETTSGEESMEIVHDLTWRNMWQFALQNYSFLRVLSSKSPQQVRMDDRRRRVEEKKLKIQRAKALSESGDTPKLTATVEAPTAPPRQETDGPVSGRRERRMRSKGGAAAAEAEEAAAIALAPTTIVNSPWVWTAICYVLVIMIAMSMITQSGLDVFAERSRTPMLISLFVLVYPAWRIGSLFSRFLRKRGIGANAVLTVPVIGTKPEPKPGSIEARMAAREARVAKAREEGKL